MRLHDITRYIDGARVVTECDPKVTMVTADSRQAKPGALFAALHGTKTDGVSYVEDAISHGATAILTEEHLPKIRKQQVLVPNARKALGEAAAAFYKHPASQLKLIGITGTNGKTTVAYLLRHLLRANGVKVGMLGTIEYDDGNTMIPAPLTTPDPVQFTEKLADMVANGVTHAVVEVSSHALDQYRVWPHTFSGAIFTNLTRDHLDYHGDMEGYLSAKRRLFTQLTEDGFAIVNAEDRYSADILVGCIAQTSSYGCNSGEITATILKSTTTGTQFEVHDHADDFREKLDSPMVGLYNVKNVLAATSAMRYLGFTLSDCAAALQSFTGVPGRLERLTASGCPTVFVDYAHTDDALDSVCGVLRPLVRGRLVLVFGCGGDRDRGKRALMARAAEAQCDLVIVTSDNPRTEDPAGIERDIFAGFAQPEAVRVIQDRALAVQAAILEAGAEDVVLVAGKGHENYQILGEVRHPMDDRQLVRNAFTARMGTGG